MKKQQQYDEDLNKASYLDMSYSRASSSRLLIYLLLACILSFTVGSCYMLYTKRFKKKDVQIQESTQYVPKYKSV